MIALITRNLWLWLSLLAMLVSSIAGAATPSGTVITNTATATWRIGASTVNASATKQVAVSPYAVGPDLSISLAGPAQAGPGATLVWKAVAANTGPSVADGAQVTFTVPPGVTNVSGLCLVLTSGTCGAVTVGTPTAAGTPVTVSLANFPVGARIEVTLRGTAPAAVGELIHQAQISTGSLVDPTPLNNVATSKTNIAAGAANTGTLSGRVWLDVNHDRVFTSGEMLFEGFVVRVYDAAGTTLVRQVATGANGLYSLAGLPAGVSYQIEFRDRAGNVVFGLPVTSESAGVGAGFAQTTSCATLRETTAPNVMVPMAGNCYSMTTGGSTAQVQRTGRTLIFLQAGDNVIEQSLPLDPAGVVYDSVTRQPVAGATVTFSGPPGYDPAQHLLGGAANSNQITGVDGFYQFLLVGGAPAGTYTLTVTPPAGYTSPSQIPPNPQLDPTGLGSGGVYLVQAQPGPPTGIQPTTYHLSFSLALGDPNVINNHIPIDPPGVGGTLILTKVASKTIASVGDFVQYQLALSNPGKAPVAGVTVSDRLPPGFRFRPGTAQIGKVAVANPAISADGRTLTFTIGTVLPGAAAIDIRYVTEITVGTSLGDAVNSAQATGAGGARSLNARATVNVKEDLFRSRTILMGRVIEVGASGPKLAQGVGTVSDAPAITSSAAGLCNPEQHLGKGIEGARIFMEDGAYIRTDKEGKWHIDGVKLGTHVVQLDVKSLPDGYEAVLCEDNTRHAGRAFSQFVNVRGGTMWRADFYVRNTGKSSNGYEAGQRLTVRAGEGVLKATLELKGVTAAVRNLSATVALPEGMTYVPNSARMNGGAFAEPEISNNILVFRAGDTSATWKKSLTFDVKGVPGAGAAMQSVAQFQSADGETRRLPPASAPLAALGKSQMQSVSEPKIIQYNHIVKETTPAAPVTPATSVAPAAAQPNVNDLNIYAPGSEKFDTNWLATVAPGLEVVYPAETFIPGTNAIKVFVKHDPAHQIKLTVNGVPVHRLNFDGNDHNAQKTVGLSRWGGVGLIDGANKVVATAVDAAGKEVGRAERMIHYSGAGVEGRLVNDASVLVADGRTAPVVAVRIFDREGKPVRHGTEGELAISAPYQSLEVVQARDSRPLLNAAGNQARWRVTDDGLALIRLQPTTTSGEVSLTLNFQGRPPQIIRAWLKPEMREWILVGLGEGTIGQRKLSGAVENLPADMADDKLWKDGRVAFYAKGQVKGEFLVTMAYDTDKERKRLGGAQGDRLLQGIDRKQYYTVYGDSNSAQHDAASTRKLYLKIEKNQWYAMFGDYNTGMTVTELSRYSRTLNGIKSEFRGTNVSYTAFATKTAQAFVKDELRPDGTSGFYRLTRGNIIPNSEKVTIETRDRFRNEVIVKSEPQSRGIDYDVDYALGTLIFRKAITGKDQNFNPMYIVVDYESEDPTRDERVTAGGRVAVRTSDGRAEAGVSAIREGSIGARGDLKGVDATVQIDDKTKLRAEYAHSSRELAGTTASGNAYVIEARRQDGNVAATAYVRGQQGTFGLGQQAAANGGTTKVGGDVSVKMSPEVTINARAQHERVENAGAQAERSQIEARANLVRPEYGAYVGGRIVRDQTSTGETQNSNQLVAGGAHKFMDGRLNLRVDSEINLGSSGGSNVNSTDFPHRVRVGADYKVTDKLSLFLDQELTFGDRENTHTTRIGTKTKPWDGAESANSLNLRQTPDGPVVSTTSSMTQAMRLSPELTVNVGMDRTNTIRKPGTTQLNPNVPAAQGVNATAGAASQSILPPAGIATAPVEDYTAVFAGATWNQGPWGATARAEYRHGDTTNKVNVAGTLHRDIASGQAIAATALYSNTRGGALADSKTLDLRLSYAFRPIDSLWVVLSRLDYIQEESNATGGARSHRMVMNNNVNYQFNRSTQIAFQYGAKYVFDNFDRVSASGFTDIYGAEMRYDFGNRFDIGAHAALLNSWGSDVHVASYGASVGFAPVRNLWLGVGYNFAGFRDRDFTSANATAKGWYLYLRMKADQGEKDTTTKRKLMFEEAAN